VTTTEQFLIDTLTEPEGMAGSQLAYAAADAGIPWDQVQQARSSLALRTVPGPTGQESRLTLDHRPCIDCGTSTPYLEPNHPLHLCPDCTSPITTWRWEPWDTPPNRGRITVIAAQRAAGWPAEEGPPQPRICGVVTNKALPGSPTCPEVALWKVTVHRGQNLASSNHWCNTHLPSKHRPATEEK